MRKAAIGLCVAVGGLSVLLPLAHLLAQGEPVVQGPPEATSPISSDQAPSDARFASPVLMPKSEVVKDNVPTMMVNTRRIRLNYGLSDVGPSGVSSVELWATRDGRAWQCYSNEPPPAGPLVVHVAEEGRYGFFLVVKSGVGTKSAPPTNGDRPQVWVEVDETPPSVKLTEVRVGRGEDAGRLLISWSADDARLMPRPITICTAPSKDGPWTPVASHLENTGLYAWAMPKEMPYQFFVKVEAADKAGNVGSACTHEAVKVDLSRPKGTILGVDLDKKPGAAPESAAAAPALTSPVTLAR